MKPRSNAAKATEDRRRRALLVATGTVGGVGGIAAAVPFVASLQPSARTLNENAPVQVDFAELMPGQTTTVLWRGKPVWMMRRTSETVEQLRRPNPHLVDPDSNRSEQPPDCRNHTRSRRADVFVCIGVCTHLGCAPRLRVDDKDLQRSLGGVEGYLCPCHGSVFDLAGRVVRNVPAPTNLEIPDHRYVGQSTLVIG